MSIELCQWTTMPHSCCVRCHSQLGTLRVYKSGKVKLQLGVVSFSLAQGIPCEVRTPALPCPCNAGYPTWPSK